MLLIPDTQRQKAAATWQQTMSSEETGQRFMFANMYVDGTWESNVLEQVESMVHMPDALATFLQAESLPTSVMMARSIAVPRYDPVVDNLHAHPAFFNRASNNMTLADAAYVGEFMDSSGKLVQDTYYAQVIAMGRVQMSSGDEKEFVYCKGYQRVSRPEDNPLCMQPLTWEPTPRAGGKRVKKANTVLGHFFILDPQALKRQVCIVPDFKLGDGHFFLNPLVHEAEDHLASIRSTPQ